MVILMLHHVKQMSIARGIVHITTTATMPWIDVLVSLATSHILMVRKAKCSWSRPLYKNKKKECHETWYIYFFYKCCIFGNPLAICPLTGSSGFIILIHDTSPRVCFHGTAISIVCAIAFDPNPAEKSIFFKLISIFVLNFVIVVHAYLYYTCCDEPSSYF